MHHPFTSSPVARHIAWKFVRPVVPTLQEVLHRERQTLGLILEDDNPLNDNDRAQYVQTMKISGSR